MSGHAGGPDADAKITEEELNSSPAPRGTGFFADRGEITKAMNSGTTSFLGIHAGREVFLDLLVEMESQFGVQMGAGLRPAESGKLGSKFVKPAHKGVPV